MRLKNVSKACFKRTERNSHGLEAPVAGGVEKCIETACPYSAIKFLSPVEWKREDECAGRSIGWRLEPVNNVSKYVGKRQHVGIFY